MTPEQALQILDQAASLARLTRADHIRVREAIGVLQTLVRANLEMEEVAQPQKKLADEGRADKENGDTVGEKTDNIEKA